MPEKKLPKNYKGYSTSELQAMLRRMGDTGSLKGEPKDKIEAMDDLAREYRLAIFKHAPNPHKN